MAEVAVSGAPGEGDAIPRVSVVIPTWNGAELLTAALRSLNAQEWRDFETIVVDNGSTDGTVETVRREFGGVRLIALPRNRGFAAAVNAGIEAARGGIVVLMNNDTEAEPSWLGALVGAADANPRIGSFASRMMDFHDRSRIDSAGDRMALMASPIGHGEPDGPSFSTAREVFSPCAGAAAYRREMLDEIGRFDERFFAYLEDVDLGFRAQIAGYGCLYVPDAVIHHHGSATSSRISDARAFWLARNTLFLFFQNMPARVLWRHGWYMLLWPFIDVLERGGKLSIAGRAWLAFWRDLPEVLRRRRRAYSNRRLSDRAIIARLDIAAPASVPPAQGGEE